MIATVFLRHTVRSSRAFSSILAPSARLMSSGASPIPNEDATSVIELPRHVGGNIADSAGVLGLDIGGTLTKLVYSLNTTDRSALICRVWPTSDFERELIPALTQLINDSSRQNDGRPFQLVTTGGGAYKFATQLKGLFSDHAPNTTPTDSASEAATTQPGTVTNEDEMTCLGAGLRFLQDSFEDEFFHCDGASLDSARGVLLPKEPGQMQSVSISPAARENLATQPLLLGNVGSGVSYLLCPPGPSKPPKDRDKDTREASEEHVETQEPRRVGGTPLGGGTIYGLLRLITNSTDFRELLKLAATGDRTKVDMTVQDVYSKAYSNIGLSGDRAASILGGIGIGKNAQPDSTDQNDDSQHIQGYAKADVARSVVFGICYNIGLMAVLQAKLHNAGNTICFTGNLVRANEMVMADIEYGVRANSNYEMRAAFMRHGGSLGAVGAWVRGVRLAEFDA